MSAWLGKNGEQITSELDADDWLNKEAVEEVFGRNAKTGLRNADDERDPGMDCDDPGASKLAH